MRLCCERPPGRRAGRHGGDPTECLLYRDLAWALEHCGAVRGHGDARRLVDERFAGMHAVHTNNNLCLIVFGLKLAEGDLMRGLSQTVAMGLDSDRTAASAGRFWARFWARARSPRSCTSAFTTVWILI